MKDILLFDQAGPVAILVLVLLILFKLTHTLLSRLLDDKDRQIERLSASNDALVGEIGETLDDILTAIKDQARVEGRRDI